MTNLLSPDELLLYADKTAEVIMRPVLTGDMSHEDAIQATAMAFEIIKSIYPFPERLFFLTQEAQGFINLIAKPPREPC